MTKKEILFKTKTRVDPDAAALAIRATIAAKMVSQSRLAHECDLKSNMVNGFLRRRFNLLDSDIEKIIKHLDVGEWGKEEQTDLN